MFSLVPVCHIQPDKKVMQFQRPDISLGFDAIWRQFFLKIKDLRLSASNVEHTVRACDNAGVILQSTANWILKVCGWTLVGTVPNFNKFVFVAASHTSNWDGYWLIIYKLALNIKLRFLAKHTLFWWPLGSLLRWFGAMPIDRRKSGTVVDDLVKAFRDEESLILALAPEGTRKWKPHWKTGFYHIAMRADVPVIMAYIDYKTRTMGIGITLYPSGDVEKDLSIIRKFYEPFVPRHPELMGPITFPPA